MLLSSGDPLSARAATLDAKLREFGNHVFPVRRRRHITIDVQDLAVDAYVEGPAYGGRVLISDDAVRLCGTTLRVAEERVIYIELRSKLLVVIEGIDADGKKRDVECANLIAALTERLALCRSTRAVRSGEPGEHDRLLSLKLRQPVGAAIGARQLKIWSRIAGLQHFRHYPGAADLSGGDSH